MPDYLQVSTSFTSSHDAAQFARSATHSRLCASAQVIGPVLTVTWENGALAEREQWQLVLKTRADRFEELAAAIVARFPHGVPDITAVPIVRTTRTHLDLIDTMTSRGI